MIPNNLKAVIQTIHRLRDPKLGCPWDIKQTHQSLIPYLIEETYECIEAIEQNSIDHIKDELGDVLLQVLLHATIAEQNHSFSLDDIAKNLNEKLIRRHPHVFKTNNNLSPEEVSEQWEEIKKEERKEIKESLIKNKLINFPSLTSAYKIGNRTNEIEFDWPDSNQVMEKVQEEFLELKEAMESRDKKHTEEEIGDLLFTLAQLSRHIGIDPEQALKKANHKFIRRFQSMEDLIESDNLDYAQLDKKEKENYWKRVKINERN